MGWLRTTVGIAMIAAPGMPMRLAGTEPTGTSLLLMRTIGIRDLALGLGTVAPARSTDGASGPWMTATLGSDVLDVVASLVAIRAIGRRDSLVAAGLAAVFVCGDVAARLAPVASA